MKLNEICQSAKKEIIQIKDNLKYRCIILIKISKLKLI